MKKFNLEEYNKLCAEFLGKTYSDDKIIINYSYVSRQNPTGACWQKCMFHSDWNWIMEVREKMSSKDIVDGSRPFTFGKLDTLIFDISTDKVIIKASYWSNPNTISGNYWVYFDTKQKYSKHTSTREAVVQAIWEFLNWYNENSNNNQLRHGKDNPFKKGEVIRYDNGAHQETFIVFSVGEYHLYSTEYNSPSFSKKYCSKIN